MAFHWAQLHHPTSLASINFKNDEESIASRGRRADGGCDSERGIVGEDLVLNCWWRGPPSVYSRENVKLRRKKGRCFTCLTSSFSALWQAGFLSELWTFCAYQMMSWSWKTRACTWARWNRWSALLSLCVLKIMSNQSASSDKRRICEHRSLSGPEQMRLMEFRFLSPIWPKSFCSLYSHISTDVLL